MLSEQYKNFPESYFSDTYKVSNFGNIKNSKTNILLKTNIFKNYIKYNCVYIKGSSVHINNIAHNAHNAHNTNTPAYVL